MENNNNTLSHHGIKGQQWGRRRYQNPDGTLTALGRKRYAKELARYEKEKEILKNRQATKAKLDELEKMKQEIEEGKRKLAGGDASKTSDTDNSTSTSKSDEQSQSKPKKASEPAQKKKLKDLSNEELRARLDRIDLETKYKDAVKQKAESKKKSDGRIKTVFKDSLEASSRNLLTQVFNHVGATALNKAFANSEKFSKKDSTGAFVDVIFSNNRKK